MSNNILRCLIYFVFDIVVRVFRLCRIGILEVYRYELERNFSFSLALKKRTTFPIWRAMSIEIHSNCNRDCTWCPRYHERKGVRKDRDGNNVIAYMPTETVHNLIEQAHKIGFKGRVKFRRLSEGFLDSRYIEFARFTKSRGMQLVENTNGDILRKNGELCSELDGLMDHLIIGLYDYRDENERQKEMAFWRRRFKRTEISFSMPKERCWIRQGSASYNDIYKDEQVLDQPCLQPYRALLIRYDGNLSLCCEDDNCTFGLGNVFESSIEDLWWSDRHIEIARKLVKSKARRALPFCNKCFF